MKSNDGCRTTINALFEINPEANEGISYQYDNVERSKRKRQKIVADDCEFCRDVCSLPSLHHSVERLNGHIYARISHHSTTMPSVRSRRVCSLRHGARRQRRRHKDTRIHTCTDVGPLVTIHASRPSTSTNRQSHDIGTSGRAL